MEFNHLPAPGGLYDQDPQLIEEWLDIWSEKSAFEKEKERREKRKAGGSTPGSSARRPRRR